MGQKKQDTGRHKHSRASAPGMWLLLALLLGGAAVGGAYLYGVSASPLPSQRAGGAPASAAAEIAEVASVYQQESPSPSPEPESGTAAEPYDYEEILSDEDGILLARIQGKRWRGVLAVVDDPTRVFVGSIPYFGEDVYGMTLDKLMEKYGAVLGLNGGGFGDATGQGRGGDPIGLVMSGGTIWQGGAGGMYDVCAFDAAGTLHVGTLSGQQCLDLGVQSAVSFGPALVIDGEIQSFATDNWEPRSAVGQRADGAMLLMALEGRQVSAQGANLKTLAEVMAAYGAVNATNLDGGASSSLLYRGELVNVCNSVGGLRAIANGILVAASGTAGEGTTP